MEKYLYQPALFTEQNPLNCSLIKGLTYIPNYITAWQETALLNQIDNQPWLNDLKRRVQHYGYKYDYKARMISADFKLGAFPEWLVPYCNTLSEQQAFSQVPDQVIINEYQPGQGISPHIDCVSCFTETIASLSLGSACVMELTQRRGVIKVPILLEPCSLLILRADARYNWNHAIMPRKTDSYNGSFLYRSRRVSLTFRNVIIH